MDGTLGCLLISGILLVGGMVLYIGLRVITEYRPTLDLANFRQRLVGPGGKGMTPINDIQARTLTWAQHSTLYGRSIDESTVHSGDALLIRYWLADGGMMQEIETAEGRWLCDWKTRGRVASVQVTKLGASVDTTARTYAYDRDRNNLIGTIKFPDGRVCHYRDIMESRLGGLVQQRSSKSQLIDEGNECLIAFDRDRNEAEIQERAMAAPGLRDLIVFGCFIAIHNTNYDWTDVGP